MDILNTKIKSILTEKTNKVRPENIKSGINILGISGNVVELNGETKTVTPTTSSQTIVPTGTGKNALTQVTVNAVTSAIDNNITAENIKKDVSILGVTGTFEGGGSGYNAEVVTEPVYDPPVVTAYNTNVYRYIKRLPDTMSTGTWQSLNNFFVYCYCLENIPYIDTQNARSMNYMMEYCVNITEIPQFNTSNVTQMREFCAYCTKLETVPILNTSSLTASNSMQNMFLSCPALTNESLNNILYMCANSGVTSNKNLKYIGLSSTQATTCTGLSNWASAQTAGWTTGY